MEEWYSLYKGGEGEIEEKKSRFIATIKPVTTPEEASEFISEMKKKYWDARHNCSAYIIGDDGSKTRCSDDGEPSGTAGRPMLDVLSLEKITNICVVVTRYFGGTLLGTGGLVRAYQGAVKEGLKSCSILKKIKGTKLQVKCDYTDFGKIQFMCNQNNIHISETDYSDLVGLSLIVEESELDDIRTKIMDVTSGKARMDDNSKIVFAIIDGVPNVLEEL